MSPTAYYWDPISLEHDTGLHVECIARAECLRPEAMREMVPDLDARDVVEHDAPEWIRRLHNAWYHGWVEASFREGRTLLDHGDTVISSGSYRAALGSVDALLTAADAVMGGEARTAFSAMRPPGHHALPDRAMGFCLFGNIAILAVYLQTHHRLERVAIVDWDVHHGNGTQHFFWRDPNVLFASMHQHPLWPGTGRSGERGEGPGENTTLNIPVAPNTPEHDYLMLFESQVVTAVDGFRPDIILISAGFDSHHADPIADLCMTEAGYAQMTRQLTEVASRHCEGRIISTLEGGYNLDALQRSVAAHIVALAE
ncbi:MAG: histone deacetylase [Planctomycetota bacterium]